MSNKQCKCRAFHSIEFIADTFSILDSITIIIYLMQLKPFLSCSGYTGSHALQLSQLHHTGNLKKFYTNTIQFNRDTTLCKYSMIKILHNRSTLHKKVPSQCFLFTLCEFDIRDQMIFHHFDFIL